MAFPNAPHLAHSACNGAISCTEPAGADCAIDEGRHLSSSLIYSPRAAAPRTECLRTHCSHPTVCETLQHAPSTELGQRPRQTAPRRSRNSDQDVAGNGASHRISTRSPTALTTKPATYGQPAKTAGTSARHAAGSNPATPEEQHFSDKSLAR
eukprot:8826724-Pyramimonas_sp.AAC.1